MFIPAMFRLDDRAAAVELIRQNSFGLLVTAPEGRATATHLPFLFDPERGEQGTLIAHMARANPQWRDFAALEAADGEALAVFQGAHAYVSPTWYGGEGPRVPTWNYMAVHAYGRPQHHDPDRRQRVQLERLEHHRRSRAGDDVQEQVHQGGRLAFAPLSTWIHGPASQEAGPFSHWAGSC